MLSRRQNTHSTQQATHSTTDGYNERWIRKRGAYTEAIAEQLNQADGESDLEDMHTRAVLQIVEKYGDRQTPEYRSTLKKRLILRK